MPQHIGIYGGSFDPITYGHMSVINKAARLFDKLIIAVGVNPAKKPMFGILERIELIRHSVKDASWATTREADIIVIGFEGRYLVHVAIDMGATHIVRGIRNATDFEAEYTQATFNDEIAMNYKDGHSIQTVFLPASIGSAHISSSAVKSLIGFDGWEANVRDLVPSPVFHSIVKQHVKARNV